MSARRSLMNTKARFPRGNKLETLETRLLFNTIITDTNPLTSTPATERLDYKDLKGNVVSIVVHGDVSAEFVFARTTKGDKDTGVGYNDIVLGDAVDPGSSAFPNPEQGRDLFHVYIAQASIDSYISIAERPFSEDARPMTPFAGNVVLHITPNRTNAVNQPTAGGSGSIYLGARTINIPGTTPNEGDVPVRTAVFNGQGLLPANAKHRLVAGVTTAPNVSIGRFYFAGAVSGEVRFLGSVETFYAGAILTGTTEGQFEGDPQDPGNFFVQGDIRNILSMSSIGTSGVAKTTVTSRIQPVYYTGTDFDIRGRVGQIRTNGDYIAYAKVSNTNSGLGLRTRQQEIEVRAIEDVNRGDFTEFENGQLGDLNTYFNNDTFETAQFLGSINSKQMGENSVQLNGVLQSFSNVNDLADYYAVPLMAGQKVTVRMIAADLFTTNTISPLYVGVFDPDKREIAADNSPGADNLTGYGVDPTIDFDPAHEQVFQFTAEKPGIYRIAVGIDPPAFGETGDRLGEHPYQVQMTGVGNLAIGGLVAEGTIDAPAQLTTTTVGNVTGVTGSSNLHANIETVLGDLGAVYSIGDHIVSWADSGVNALAQGGDLRAIDANSIGTVTGSSGAGGTGLTVSSNGGNFLAYTGSVGMIRARGTSRDNTIARFNLATSTSISGNSSGDPTELGLYPAIGGDIQYIEAPSTLWTDAACNGSIGVVHAGQFGTTFYAGSLTANADGKGAPETIDLIDVTQDLGTLSRGGPVISAGPGGDVRYIHIASSSTAYRPLLFGGSQPEETTYSQGQKANITDDSGAQVEIIPTQQDVLDSTGNVVLDPVTLEPLSNSGTLTVLTYPVARGAGGAGTVILRITSTRGVTVRTNGGNTQIGEIRSNGTGPSLVSDPEDAGSDGIANTNDDPFILDPNSTIDNSVVFKGTNTDVFSIIGNNFNQINNTTTGEIVNINAGQVGTIRARTLGLAKSTVRDGMLTQGSQVADISGTTEVEGNTFPFNDARNAIIVRGTSQTGPAIQRLYANESLGNVMILGMAQEIRANADGVGVKGLFEGIVGAIFAKGQLKLVNVGEGLLPSGTGDFGKAGIYCIADRDVAISNSGIGRIERVINGGTDSDIRGNIVSNTGIGSIEVSNGSIINATFGVLSSADNPVGIRTGEDLRPSNAFSQTAVIVQGTDSAGRVLGNIDRIVVNGYGGIIGLLARTNNMGPISSVGGFGIMNSEFTTLGNGRFSPIVADGYGLRGVDFRGGQSLESINVTGDGSRLKTTAFEPSVRLSESLAIDPFYGIKPSPLTDLHVVLGTTKASPIRKGVSNSGSIDLSTLAVSRDVTLIKANTIRASTFNIANNLNTLETNDYVDTLRLNVGRVSTIAIGKDALRSDFEVAGPTGNVHIGGSFRGSSKFNGNGQNGSIGTFTTDKSLYGNVYAQAGMGTIRVGTVYGSQGTSTPKNIDAFITGGDFLSSAVLSVGKRDTDSGGRIGKLVIGGDLQDAGLIRLHSLGTKTIIGDEIGVIDLWPWET